MRPPGKLGVKVYMFALCRLAKILETALRGSKLEIKAVRITTCQLDLPYIAIKYHHIVTKVLGYWCGKDFRTKYYKGR